MIDITEKHRKAIEVKNNVNNVFFKITTRLKSYNENNKIDINIWLRFFLFYLLLRKCSDIDIRYLFELNKNLLDAINNIYHKKGLINKMIKLLEHDELAMQDLINGCIVTKSF